MTTVLDEDIRTAALEALVPSELEQHLAMNRARLITNEQVRSEIQACIEARRSQCAFKIVAAKNTSDPMDVDSIGKGGKRGGKNGKKGGKGHNQSHNPNPNKEIVCWHCGKKAHLRTGCWSNPKNQAPVELKTKEAKGNQ